MRFHDHLSASPGCTMARSVDQIGSTNPDDLWHSASLNTGWLNPTRYYWIPETWGHTSSNAFGP